MDNLILYAISLNGFTCLGIHILTEDDIYYYLGAVFAIVGLIGATWWLG